ncbi:hypothetical protein LC040_12070 [Bacillus tianshenii]|nr:hypothetical protein LC040_12070 [Bacillus tianshenii]
MPAPATTGQLRTNIVDMKIGDYILWNWVDYDSWQINVDNGNSESPIGGVTGMSGYYWYGIKVAKGLLVADRVVLHSQSWDWLNSKKWIEGKYSNLLDENNTIVKNGYIRSLTGGCACADENGNMSLTDKGYGGFPTNNEWDKYIVNFPSKLIADGATLDEVFHWSGIVTLCQETPVNGWLGTDVRNKHRIGRGYDSSLSIHGQLSNEIFSSRGFRPVFQYKEN